MRDHKPDLGARILAVAYWRAQCWLDHQWLRRHSLCMPWGHTIAA